MASASDVSLRQLQYVVAVADALGFHKAARQCAVSQPSLSAQVKQLEDVLGLRLFERDRRRVLVTPAGRDIVDRARRALREVEELVRAAAKQSDPMAGPVRIGVIPTVAPYLLPEVVPAIHASFTGLRPSFTETKTETIVASLEAGTLDLGLLALVPELAGLDHAEICEDRFVVALPKDHPLVKRKVLRQSDLEGESVLLLDDGHCFRTQALAVCDLAGAGRAELAATSLATLAQMVSVGAGITLLPSLAVGVENRRGQLEVRRLTPEPSRTLAVVWRAGSVFEGVGCALAQVMKKALRAAAA